jgi:hypothetical protein
MPRNFSQPASRRAWIRQLLGPMDEEKWDGLARELFAWQFARVPAYRRLCWARGVTPATLISWRQIPAMPQSLFKQEKLFSHGSAKPGAVYETSGTTTGQPGRQHLLYTDIYRAVSVEGARRAGLFAADPQLYFLTPSPKEARHSSLSAMFGFWSGGGTETKPWFLVRNGKFEFDRLREVLERAVLARRPVALCGTAFSFVHLLDAWAGQPPLRLPPGSCLLETGGFKGRSREVSKPELYAELGRMFSTPDNAIWNEYGMSELSSQAYARGTSGLHLTPPWARVLIWDPATDREVAVGRRGLVRWIDLANVDSVLAVQTLDIAERTTHGFRLVGRLARTEPRGCSLSAEDIDLASKKNLAVEVH